jgi:hypothetical protein
MFKSYKMKNELRSASEVTLTNYMTGSGEGDDTSPADDTSSTSTLDVIALTNLANSDLNLVNKSKEVLASNNTANTLFNNNNNNNNHTHHPLHQLHHLHHHHLHRPYDRSVSWTAANCHSDLSKYTNIVCRLRHPDLEAIHLFMSQNASTPHPPCK